MLTGSGNSCNQGLLAWANNDAETAFDLLKRGLAGAALGGIVGYLVFGWLARQGLYALVLPGASLGLGCALLLTMTLIPVLNFLAMPVGVAGELCMSGASVARGYFKRGALTAEKFIPDPFSDEAGARLYKTGDLGRYQQDGNIQYQEPTFPTTDNH